MKRAATIMNLVALGVLKQITSAFKTLNPQEVRGIAERPVVFGVLAADESCVDQIHEFLGACPGEQSHPQIVRIASESDFRRVTIGFSERGIPHPQSFFEFDPISPRSSVDKLLDQNEEDWIALARSFPGLRRMISERLIWKIARENTLFTVATSVPNIVPSVLTLPWTAGEFASDTAFLTVNQVRLSLLLAAAHGHEVGYDKQTLKIGSIVGAAIGWRAMARQLVSKVPAGGGLVSKGLIAFAGTYVMGRGLEHWHREGSLMDRATQRAFYADAYSNAKETVDGIVRHVLSASGAAERTAS